MHHKHVEFLLRKKEIQAHDKCVLKPRNSVSKWETWYEQRNAGLCLLQRPWNQSLPIVRWAT